MRILLVAWLLLVVTLASVAIAATNWYEYDSLDALSSDERGVRAASWEPVIAVQTGDRAVVYVRRPRLRFP